MDTWSSSNQTVFVNIWPFRRSTTPSKSTLWTCQPVTWWRQMVWSMWWRMFFIPQVSRDHTVHFKAIKYNRSGQIVVSGCLLWTAGFNTHQFNQRLGVFSRPALMFHRVRGFFFVCFCHIRWCICNVWLNWDQDLKRCWLLLRVAPCLTRRRLSNRKQVNCLRALIWLRGGRPTAYALLNSSNFVRGWKKKATSPNSLQLRSEMLRVTSNQSLTPMWDTWRCSDDTCRPPCGPWGPPVPAEEADQIHPNQGKEKVDQKKGSSIRYNDCWWVCFMFNFAPCSFL